MIIEFIGGPIDGDVRNIREPITPLLTYLSDSFRTDDLCDTLIVIHQYKVGSPIGDRAVAHYDGYTLTG